MKSFQTSKKGKKLKTLFLTTLKNNNYYVCFRKYIWSLYKHM